MTNKRSVLLEQISRCVLCSENIENFSGIIQPTLQISTRAKVLIIGQAPGVRTLSSGRPFDDVSGQRLRDWLGVSREQFYDSDFFAIMPMAFCYPGKGLQGDLPPPTICSQTWHRQLLDAMRSIELTIYLGQYASKHYLGKTRLFTEQVKDFQSLLPTRVALPHPSPRNRFWLKQNPWFEKDLLPLLKNRVSQLSV